MKTTYLVLLALLVLSGCSTVQHILAGAGNGLSHVSQPRPQQLSEQKTNYDCFSNGYGYTCY